MLINLFCVCTTILINVTLTDLQNPLVFKWMSVDIIKITGLCTIFMNIYIYMNTAILLAEVLVVLSKNTWIVSSTKSFIFLLQI